MNDISNSPQQQTQIQVPPQLTPDPQLQQTLDQAAATTQQQLQQDPAATRQLATTPELQNIVVEIEEALLAEIMKNLDSNAITPEYAQQTAKEFLAVLPIQDKTDLLDKLNKLSQTHRELTSIYLQYAKPYEDEERQRKLHLMSEHIKKGQIEHALAIAKGEMPHD